jgi:hypothetical protein
MQRRCRARLLHDQGQDVEPAPGLPAGPSESVSQLRQLRVHRIARDRRAGLVAGVPDQLRGQDPRAGPSGRVRGEHRDDRPDPAVVRRLPQMRDRLGGNVGRRRHLPPIANPQAPPVEPANAAGTVAPRHASRKRQLGRRVPVRPRLLDLAAHLGEPLARCAGRVGILGVEQPDEPLRLRQDVILGWPGRTPIR